MKVICDRTALLDAVNLVTGVVVQRSPTAVLKCVKLAAKDGVLMLSATDLEVGLRLGVGQVDVQEEGEAVIPADKFSQIVRSSDDATLTFETENDAVNIRGPKSHFKIYGFDASEFPQVREFGTGKPDCEFDTLILGSLIARTLFAAASEHSRYAINGVLVERKGKKVRFVATDGRRLAVAKGDTRPAGEGDTSCIVPTKALLLLSKMLRDPEEPVQIELDENQIVFKIGDGPEAAMLSSNLVEGAFPPFEDVIPKDQDKKVTFDAHELSSAVRRAALLTNEESKGVRLAFSPSVLTLTSRAPDMGEAVIELDVSSYQGDPIEIGFNPSYITDALKVMDGSQVIVELKAPNKPGVLRSDHDFTYVLMPVNLQ